MKRLACLAVLPLLVAACGSGGGGSTTTTSATDQWANDLCGAVVTWQGSLADASGQLKSGTITKSAVTQTVDDATAATKTLTDSLGSLGKPDTQSGQEAAANVATLTSQLDDGMQKITDATTSVSGLSGVAGAVSVVSATLATMGSQVTTTVSQLKALDAESELQQAFAQSSSCTQLSGSSG